MDFNGLKIELTEYLLTNAGNYIKPDDAMREDLVGLRMFDEPLFGALASVPRFREIFADLAAAPASKKPTKKAPVKKKKAAVAAPKKKTATKSKPAPKKKVAPKKIVSTMVLECVNCGIQDSVEQFEGEDIISVRSRELMPRSSVPPIPRLSIPPWRSTTPFGTPVEPDV